MVGPITHPLIARLILPALLALLVTLLLIPRVGGQSTHTLAVDIAFTESSFGLLRDPGNQGLPAQLAPLRGDIFSGQGVLHRPGQREGERLGTAYFLGVGTAAATTQQEFDAVANHFYFIMRLEHLGHGSLDLTGTVKLDGTPAYLSVVGGTGSYYGATGQCMLRTISAQPPADHVTCDLR
jgi:hypothetical protein